SLALAAMAGPANNPEERSGLLAAARSGDLPAFERLMRQYERLVLVTALRLAGNLPDAQDVSQEVFLKLYRNLGKLDSEDAVAAWLYRVTVNACHDLRRRYGCEDSLVGQTIVFCRLSTSRPSVRDDRVLRLFPIRRQESPEPGWQNT